MKFENFYLTCIAIIICVYITFAPNIEAYDAEVSLDLHACSCKIWVENSTHYRIGGDGPNDYYDCSSGNDLKKINFPNETFWVHAKVLDSLRQEKIRGPFDSKTCLRIHGYLDRWYFDAWSC
ncbi:hypothetical protein C2G38_2242520 [Gigaspora rosea]|uniref:Uncharacterized protein n=1 Tax=Gigaspora rosea TaxID=44941 RepID=A0A397VUI9_9GLOM|nr:hypothetical protein C2G38_2242520 [Gigaspora rosea]CAG8483361.1 6612_t:CDS:2 [Gigaspora rosea]